MGRTAILAHYIFGSTGCVTGRVHGPPSSPSALPQPCAVQVFQKLATEKKGKVQVFFCGFPALAKVLKDHCKQFSFKFFQGNF